MKKFLLSLPVLTALAGCGTSATTTTIQTYDVVAYDVFASWVSAYDAKPTANPTTVQKLNTGLAALQAAITAYNASPSPDAATALNAALAVLAAIQDPALPAIPSVTKITAAPATSTTQPASATPSTAIVPAS
jgi:hypothetical protein